MATKQLTAENYAQRDPTNDAFAEYDPGLGKAVQVSGARRASAYLSIEIDPRAPGEVHELFEVARGTLLYGKFYYPLFTVGEEQFGRVADAAAGHRYAELGGPL